MNGALGNAASVPFFAPELCLSAGAGVVLLVDRALARSPRGALGVAVVTLAFLGGAAALTAHAADAAPLPIALFDGLFVLDPWATFFRYLYCAATALAVVVAAPSRELGAARLGPYCALLLAIAVGLSVMTSAADFVCAALGLELVSIAGYALAGFRPHSRASAEAALKYAVSGGVASGLMLFGLSWLYGITGSTSMIGSGALIHGFLARAGQGSAAQVAVAASLVLVLAGLGFKVAAVPWHMWCPDVYEGAPTPFTAFLSVAPRAAGFGLLVRFSQWVVGGVDVPWAVTIGVLAAVTMTWGNAAALSQTNVKRLLAYSAIAQAGYLLLGVAAATIAGTEAIAIALAVFLFGGLGSFLVVGVVGRAEGEGILYEFRGLSARAPFTAIAMALFLFSLAGVPPLAGFVGKFHLVKALVDTGGTWQRALALVALFNSVLSLSYYARVVKAMFVDRPVTTAQLEVPAVHHVLLGVLALGVVALGIGFDGLRQWAAASAVMFSP